MAGVYLGLSCQIDITESIVGKEYVGNVFLILKIDIFELVAAYRQQT